MKSPAEKEDEVAQAIGVLQAAIQELDRASVEVLDAESHLRDTKARQNRATVDMHNARNALVKAAPEIMAGYVPDRGMPVGQQVDR